jgi:hypothetical protein
MSALGRAPAGWRTPQKNPARRGAGQVMGLWGVGRVPIGDSTRIAVNRQVALRAQSR